jgi:acyl-CoA thioester hydrolase
MRSISYIDHLPTWEKDFTFFCTIKVRFSETDMFGHVNNTTVLTYFEEARIEFFKSIGLMQDWMKEGSNLIPVVADLQCDYLAQTYFDEQLNVFVKVNKVGRTSVDLHYLVKKMDGTIAFAGRGAVVQISRISGRPVQWNEKWKESLSNLVGEQERHTVKT